MTQKVSKYTLTLLQIISVILILSGCSTSRKSPELDPLEDESIVLSQTEIQRSAPIIIPANVSEKNDFITFKANYTKIETYADDLIMSNINHQIEKKLMSLKNKTLLNAAILSTYEASDDNEQTSSTPVDYALKGAVSYGDAYIFSYAFDEMPSDNMLSGEYLNFDLKTGQEIKLLDLVTEEMIRGSFEELTASQYSKEDVSISLDGWDLDHAYRFIDRRHIGLYAPPYQLSNQQVEPAFVMMTIPEYMPSETLHPIGTSIDYDSKCEYNNGFNLCYTYPVVEGSTPIIHTINTTVKTDIESTMNYNIDLAIDDHTAQIGSDYPWRPYIFSADYEVFQNTKDTLSFVIKYYQYTGGAHGIGYTVAYNYNLADGKEMRLSDLFEPGFDYTTYINDQIYNQIQGFQPEENTLWDTTYGFNGITEDQTFYLEDNTLQIYFGVYEIAPYSAGEPTFEIPLDKHL